MSTRTRFVLAVLVCTCLGLCAASAADAPADDAKPAAAAQAPAQGLPGESYTGVTLWQIVVWGGGIEFVIILCSFLSMTLIIEHFCTIRFGRAMPEDLVQTVRTMMANREYSQVLSLCQSRPCFFSNVVAAGLQRVKHDFHAVQAAVADTIDRQGIALHAKISYLSFLANVSPLLGLLGTVWGMMWCFNEIAQRQALGRAEMLAKGVFQALITTVTGLIVAIPVMACFFFFRDRINRIILEVEAVAAELFEAFRPTRKMEEAGRP